jgi:membrane associated rhomboid family serine protease
VFILPLGHEDFVVKRLPWITIGIAVVCTLLQVRACAVEGGLAKEARSLAVEILKIEMKALSRYAEKEEEGPTAEEVLESFQNERGRESLKQALEKRAQILQDFRQGKLSDPGDPLLARWQELHQRLEQVKNKIPAQQLGYRPAIDGRIRMLSYAFAHGGWLHLIFNLWFLYLVGCNLEDRWGRLRFLLFYLAGAMIAALSFKIWHPDGTLPLVGASGAVAACMGAFMVCFGGTRIRFAYAIFLLFFFRWGTFTARAFWALLLWFLGEAVDAFFEGAAPGSTAVAYSSHVGGFLMGAVIAGLWRITGFDEKMQTEVDEKDVVFRENPLFARAIDLRKAGRAREAMQVLNELVAQDPRHQPALEEMFLLSLELKDDDTLHQSAAGLIGSYTLDKNFSQVINAYKRILEYAPSYVPEDKTLLQVVRAAREVGDMDAALEAVETLEEEHPESTLIPRALWDTADTQQKRGWEDEARVTLETIIERYPMDPLADQAKRRLVTMQK